MTAPTVNTADMWLIYVSNDGQNHYQHWNEVTEVGGLIDPDTGDDWELIGWTDKLPASQREWFREELPQ